MKRIYRWTNCIRFDVLYQVDIVSSWWKLCGFNLISLLLFLIPRKLYFGEEGGTAPMGGPSR